ncbi:MAG: DegV family protein [Tepidibacillus sp.]
MNIKIITDSAADLSKNVIEQYNIDVIPLQVFLNDQQFEDGVTIQPNELFQGMREGNVYKTSQPLLTRFKDVFEKYAKEKTSCIYIAFSSGLSGTYQSSVMIKNEVLEEYPDFDCEIFDTKCASVGLGLVVLKAAQLAANGKSKAEILEAIDFYANHMEHVFTVDNLEYLYRGGRVSRTAAIIGGLLNIKPVLNVEDGKLVPIEKIRGRKRVFKRMIELMEERGNNLREQTIGICHGDDEEGAETLKIMIREKFGTDKFYVNIIGAVIGAHAGPGTLSVFFLNKEAK